MTEHTFNKGDTVYSIEGHEAEYLSEGVHGDHIVLPMYDRAPDDGPYYGDPVTWSEVFAEPPKPRLAADIAEQITMLESLQQQVAEREAQLRELKRGDQERLARLKQHRQLARIDDWLAGKITHFVVWKHYGMRVQIVTWDELMNTGERRQDKLPLLVVNGTLEWYSDYARMGIDWCIRTQDSYNTQRVMPCSSEQEARQFATEAVNALTTLVMRERRQHNKSGYDHQVEELVESMRELSIVPAPDVQAAYEDSRRDAAATALTRARQEQDKAQRELQKAEAQARTVGLEVEA